MKPSPAAALAFVSRHRFMIALLATAAIEQTVATMVRVGTSYRAVEFGASFVIIGLITAGYALLPILVSVKVGRYVDLGYDTRVARFGVVLLVASCIGFTFATNWIGLLVPNMINGVAHTSLFIAIQVMCARDDSPGAIVRAFGNLTLASAIGQGVGSGLISLLGGSATIANAEPIFIVAASLAGIAAIAGFLIPSWARPEERREHTESQPATPIGVILSRPGLVVLLFVSIVSVVSSDLLVVYLPLVGVERSVGVGDIGAMLTLRAFASALARFSFAKLHGMFGGHALLLVSTLVSGACLAVIALPIPVWAMYAAVGVSGFALGVATTAALASTMTVLSADIRGTATSLRLIGNRIMQFVAPSLLGLVAAASGAGAIFAVVGVWLLASSFATWWRRPTSR